VILAQIQKSVELLHDVTTDLDIEAYWVGENSEFPGARVGVPEQLFICEHQDDVEVALYIAPEIIEHLERDDPHKDLHAGNLESFCIALEGVSHFVHYAWCVNVGRNLTALELEVQAEVDKFVLSWLHLHSQGTPLSLSHAGLTRQLFHSYTLHDGMEPDEISRYHTANRVARKFCEQLVGRFSKTADPDGIRGCVRAFIRQGLQEKLKVF
jgi:hypothetical protein